jgi:hypothetical protein
MSVLSRFLKNRQGNAVDKWVLYGAVVAVICTLGAHAMDDLASSNRLPVISFNWRNTNPGVDYTATASIPNRARSTRLDPCQSK